VHGVLSRQDERQARGWARRVDSDLVSFLLEDRRASEQGLLLFDEGLLVGPPQALPNVLAEGVSCVLIDASSPSSSATTESSCASTAVRTTPFIKQLPRASTPGQSSGGIARSKSDLY